jgi:anti-sigma B factor antagonist
MGAGGEPRGEPELRVTRTRGPSEIITLSIRGEVDLVTAPQLRAALDEARQGPPRDLELDLHECTFIDSTGLQAIVQTGRSLAASGHTLTLRRPQAHVLQLFLTAGIDRIDGLRVAAAGAGAPDI